MSAALPLVTTCPSPEPRLRLCEDAQAPLRPESRKHPTCVAQPEMPPHDFVEDGSEVGRDRQVALFVALLAREAGPAAVDFAASHAAAEDHHRVAVTVIGSAVAVLGDGSAEL